MNEKTNSLAQRPRLHPYFGRTQYTQLWQGAFHRQARRCWRLLGEDGELSRFMQSLVDDGKIAGGVTMMARHGKVIHPEGGGYGGSEAKRPMTDGRYLPHRFDDETDHQRGRDDAVGAGQARPR